MIDSTIIDELQKNLAAAEVNISRSAKLLETLKQISSGPTDHYKPDYLAKLAEVLRIAFKDRTFTWKEARHIWTVLDIEPLNCGNAFDALLRVNQLKRVPLGFQVV